VSGGRLILLPRDGQRVLPWRNGGGSTREVAVEPDAGAACGFRWRVSVARVEADGPFSAFPGVDRTLWLLAGAGMELHVEGAVHRLSAPFASLTFRGEAAVQARLRAGATEDLNVMVDRARCRVAAEVLQLAAGEERAWSADAAGADLVVALRESVSVVAPGGEAHDLQEGDALRLDAGSTPRRWTVRAARPAAVLAATFAPLAAGDVSATK
jgi:environmental stress-induced protein Ves